MVRRGSAQKRKVHLNRDLKIGEESAEGGLNEREGGGLGSAITKLGEVGTENDKIKEHFRRLEEKERKKQEDMKVNDNIYFFGPSAAIFKYCILKKNWEKIKVS